MLLHTTPVSPPTIDKSLLEPLSGDWLPKRVDHVHSVVFLFRVGNLYFEPPVCSHEQSLFIAKTESLVAK